MRQNIVGFVLSLLMVASTLWAFRDMSERRYLLVCVLEGICVGIFMGLLLAAKP